MAVPAGLWKGTEDEFGTMLGTQWAARARPTGPAALAVALLVGAVREAGLTQLTDKRVTPRLRANARAYLTGATDHSEPLPLESACALVGVNPDRVRRAVLRRLDTP